ncbi:hypothetical protein EDF56_102206 [Novosphingobium sp. PhB165]|uniref:hypothetical protein n=1 Tax=Novosphingobium sp. PhB165 TaxID=2485105 RepID=UPI00104B5DD3|nr:hypothetical protein [Novosphingobium sp. PhB165]TCM20545.1 hypothetical protein EDF56_102206 [Novosphingobium sp. PhB165]
MDDIDTILSRLGTLPLDPRLGDIDDAVLTGLAARAASRVSARTMATVIVLSLGVGIVGSVVPAPPIRAAATFPLGAPAALAPSTLLGGD